MKLSPRTRFFLKVVGGLVLGIQFIPVFPRTNPPTITRLPWDSPTTEAFARASCFDCHSNETHWPWYSYIAPVSWVIVRDVNQGREQLNFSELTSDDGPGPLIKRINNGSMPPPPADAGKAPP